MAKRTNKDGIRLIHKDNLHVVLRGPDGKIKKEGNHSNQVQTYMLTHVADRLADVGENAMSHMSVGSGTGQGVAATSLATQLARLALDGGTPSHAAGVVTYKRTFAAGEGTGTITEAGVHNAVSGGSMGLYNDGLNYAKGAADSLELTWTLTFS